MFHGRSKCCHCLIQWILPPLSLWNSKHCLGEELKAEPNVYWALAVLFSALRFFARVFCQHLSFLWDRWGSACFVAVACLHAHVHKLNIIHHVTGFSQQEWAIPIHSTATRYFCTPMSICIENGTVTFPRLDLITLWELYAQKSARR